MKFSVLKSFPVSEPEFEYVFNPSKDKEFIKLIFFISPETKYYLPYFSSFSDEILPFRLFQNFAKFVDFQSISRKFANEIFRVNPSADVASIIVLITVYLCIRIPQSLITYRVTS